MTPTPEQFRRLAEAMADARVARNDPAPEDIDALIAEVERFARRAKELEMQICEVRTTYDPNGLHGDKNLYDFVRAIVEGSRGGEVERLRRELTIAEKKNAHSLANNLCPDHRDKQQGKPCLACEVERLRKLVNIEQEGGK
jgi:hypothetical protein